MAVLPFLLHQRKAIPYYPCWFIVTTRADITYTQNTQAAKGPRNTRGPPRSQRWFCNLVSGYEKMNDNKKNSQIM